MLIRRFVNASFRLLMREAWNATLVVEYNTILTDHGGPLWYELQLHPPPTRSLKRIITLLPSQLDRHQDTPKSALPPGRYLSRRTRQSARESPSHTGGVDTSARTARHPPDTLHRPRRTDADKNDAAADAVVDPRAAS